MDTKTILARLHCTLESDVLVNQLLLLPGRISSSPITTRSAIKDKKHSAIVVGYNGSPNSQVALDLAFCVAHQMHLATQKQVMIHVVYVVDCLNSAKPARARHRVERTKLASGQKSTKSSQTSQTSTIDCGTALLTQFGSDRSSLEEIDRVLWQARCLAEEWRGSFSTHLRFGKVVTELGAFIAEENAALLFVGCDSVSHPLVQQLKPIIHCPVLGIPTPIQGAYAN